MTHSNVCHDESYPYGAEAPTPLRAELNTPNKQANAKSMKISALRKPDQGTNYGEFLYMEGLERRGIKAEQVRLIKDNERREEESETTFTPRISQVNI